MGCRDHSLQIGLFEPRPITFAPERPRSPLPGFPLPFRCVRARSSATRMKYSSRCDVHEEDSSF